MVTLDSALVVPIVELDTGPVGVGEPVMVPALAVDVVLHVVVVVLHVVLGLVLDGHGCKDFVETPNPLG